MEKKYRFIPVIPSCEAACKLCYDLLCALGRLRASSTDQVLQMAKQLRLLDLARERLVNIGWGHMHWCRH
jgi:hypothetical protein